MNRQSRVRWRETYPLAITLLLVCCLAARPAVAIAATTVAEPQGLEHAFSDLGPADNRADFDVLAALRLMVGDAGIAGPVRPHDLLTRAEFAALALRVAGLEDAAPEGASRIPSFVDGPSIPVWAWGYVNLAQARGVLTGYPDGAFRASAPVRLAEGLAILARLLGRADEVLPGLSWPDSLLELGARTGLAGEWSGFADADLERAAAAHLVATALGLPLDNAGSGRDLLHERFGYQSGLLSAVSPAGITVDGQLHELAGLYLCSGSPLRELLGQRIELLSLPAEQTVAFVAPAGGLAWSDPQALGYLMAAPGPAAERAAGYWMEGQAALVAQPAAAGGSGGSLRSTRVQLTWPLANGSPVDGAVLVAGRTTESELWLREDGAAGGWIPVPVREGRFGQFIYLGGNRGARGLQFMIPASGSPGFYRPDLAFSVDNRTSFAADRATGAAVLWPRAAVAEMTRGYVDVAGYAPTALAVLETVSGGRRLVQEVPTRDGYFSARVWLTRGAGDYAVRVCLDLDGEPGGTYRYTDAVQMVRSAVDWPPESLAPGLLIESGAPEVHRLAVEIAGAGVGAYAQARAIYGWLTTHWAYDVERSREAVIAPLATRAIIARGEGVCEDYANVFAALCRTLGIPARIAVGVIADGSLHAWNEFEADGRWVSVDATWGAGFVRDGRFVPAPSDAWFDRDLSATHKRSGERSDWSPAGGISP